MLEAWRRHDLVRVRPQAWSRMLDSRPDLARLPHVARWVARGWPLVVRRYVPADDPALVPVALPLPPANGKLRLARQLDKQDICGALPPPTLRSLCREVPSTWRTSVDVLLKAADHFQVEPRVFGSLLWQHLTGLSYLSASSDLDLLWPVATLGRATALVDHLATLEQHAPMHFDGEVLLPDGSGVQWRELQRGAVEVLVKTSHDVQLRAVADLFAEAAFT